MTQVKIKFQLSLGVIDMDNFDAFQTLLGMPNKENVILFLILIAVCVTGIIRLKDWIFERFGLETKYQRKERKQDEKISYLEGELDAIKAEYKDNIIAQNQFHDKVKDKQDLIFEDIKALQESIDLMQYKQDSATRARLKDRIGQSYRYYKERKHWTIMEKEAFNDLISSYEAAGGSNSFVHSKCLPESLTWEIVDSE